MTSVTTGIATRLAMKPTSDTCWKKTSVSGVRPSVAIACVRRPPRAAATNRAGQARQPEAAPVAASGARVVAADDAISKPTAMNDSQKPGWVSTHGSNTVTTTAATRRTSAHGQRRPAACSSVTVASIQIVRCDGTPPPAKNAYAVAAARPPARAALGAGHRSIAPCYAATPRRPRGRRATRTW